MNYCPFCGHKLNGTERVCPECGAQLDTQSSTAEQVRSTEVVKHPEIVRREIILCVILSIVTCGFFGLYWIYKLNDEINLIVEDREATSGGMVILFDILTCGIYGIYWFYKMGCKIDQLKGTSESKILYLVLSIVGLGIVSLALMQDEVNNYA